GQLESFAITEGGQNLAARVASMDEQGTIRMRREWSLNMIYAPGKHFHQFIKLCQYLRMLPNQRQGLGDSPFHIQTFSEHSGQHVAQALVSKFQRIKIRRRS